MSAADFDVDLLEGLALDLAAGGIASWSPEGGTYAPPQFPTDVVGTFLMTVPGSPDRIVSLASYLVSDDPSQAMSVMGVQVRTRWAGGDPRAVMRLSGAIFDRWHGRSNWTLTSGVTISQCLRKSGSTMGQDGSKRWGWSDNYYLDVNRPGDNRY